MVTLATCETCMICSRDQTGKAVLQSIADKFVICFYGVYLIKLTPMYKVGPSAAARDTVVTRMNLIIIYFPDISHRFEVKRN